jgi:tetratricopeptide (TPR) repeat protein
MKKTLTLALLLIAVGSGSAQKIQHALVREQNSGRKPVPGAQVIFTDAVPATSDQAGRFRLAFQNKKAGDLVFLTEIQKAGYELVNNKEVEQLKLGSGDSLGTDIILAKAGVLEAAKKEYYAISDKALKVGFEKEKAALRAQLQGAQVTQEQYLVQLEALQKQFDTQQKELDQLAEKFARVNFDDVSGLYREALQLFKDGKINEAIARLEGADLLGRTEKRLKERDRIQTAEKVLAEQKADNEAGIKEDIGALRLQAQLYVLNAQPKKAETLYDRLLLLDSSSLELLQECADFYRENHFYEKALRVLPLIIDHPGAEEWQRANAHGNTGEVLTAIGQLGPALEAYLASEKGYQQLLKKDSEDSFFKNNLAISYSKLGQTHADLGNLQQALSFFEQDLQLTKSLYEAFPNNVSFKNGLAISYEKLGNTHAALGNLQQALSFSEQYNLLEKSLYEAFPNNVEFKNNLAISYQILGNTHADLGNLQQALSFFEERSRLGKELYEAFPNNVSFKNGLAISYSKLGQTHAALGNLQQALTFFEQYNLLKKELYEAFPNSVSFKNNLAISYIQIGSFYETKKQDIPKARNHYQKSLGLLKELVSSNPDYPEFKENLDWIEQKLKEIKK